MTSSPISAPSLANRPPPPSIPTSSSLSSSSPPPPVKDISPSPPPSSPPTSLTTSSSFLHSPSTSLVRRNFLIHLLYIRGEWRECRSLCDSTLRELKGHSEYSHYVLGLIDRQRGRLRSSLEHFQSAILLNEKNYQNLKSVGKSLELMGKHKQAMEIFKEAERVMKEQGEAERKMEKERREMKKMNNTNGNGSGNANKPQDDNDDDDDDDSLLPFDWEIYHHLGNCSSHLKLYSQSLEFYKMANSKFKHDVTFIAMGRVLTLMENYADAIEYYQDALEFSPSNPDILTTIGLLHLRLGDNNKAYEYLTLSLRYDPKNAKTILAAGSIIQDHNQMDNAISKYRIAAVGTPNSAQLWNNIGMCLYGKYRYVAAISCLKRAMQLDPFEWIIFYNLGLIHIATEQYASAFHFISASIHLKSDFPSSYLYLGQCAAHLEDFSAAAMAFERAISMENDHIYILNYIITIIKHNGMAKKKKSGKREEEEGELMVKLQELWTQFTSLWDELEDEVKHSDAEVAEMVKILQNGFAKMKLK